MENQEQRNPNLLSIAKARVCFKKNLILYLFINALLTGIWFYSSYQSGYHIIFWPIWSIIWWGVGLIYQYIKAYHFNADIFSVDKEYKKLV